MLLYNLQSYYEMRFKLLLKMEQYKMAELGLDEATDPAGKLSVRKRAGGYELYEMNEQGEQYLRKTDPKARVLARDMIRKKLRDDILFCSSEINKILNRIGKCGRMLMKSHTNFTIGRIGQAFPRMESNVLAEMLSDIPRERIEWLRDTKKWSETYSCKNTGWQKELVYETKSGFWVRSKSESKIADRLYEYNIPFCYEAEIRRGDIVRYPDFILLRPDGSVVVWEHRGRDDYEYVAKGLSLISFYNEAGYSFHDNLIFTTESDIRTLASLDRIILRYYFVW